MNGVTTDKDGRVAAGISLREQGENGEASQDKFLTSGEVEIY